MCSVLVAIWVAMTWTINLFKIQSNLTETIKKTLPPGTTSSAPTKHQKLKLQQHLHLMKACKVKVGRTKPGFLISQVINSKYAGHNNQQGNIKSIRVNLQVYNSNRYNIII